MKLKCIQNVNNSVFIITIKVPHANSEWAPLLIIKVATLSQVRTQRGRPFIFTRVHATKVPPFVTATPIWVMHVTKSDEGYSLCSVDLLLRSFC